MDALEEFKRQRNAMKREIVVKRISANARYKDEKAKGKKKGDEDDDLHIGELRKYVKDMK